MPENHNITGLVVCGGKSTRMGSDKSQLVYHTAPQWLHLYHMLSALCNEVYLSVNETQAAVLPAQYPLLPDLPVFREAGPVAALLTAAAALPGRHLLLVGCDYPFLHTAELRKFLSLVDIIKPAAFYNEAAQVYEPLLAYYPAAVAAAAYTHFNGKASLQALLRGHQADPYLPADPLCIQSADTPEQYREALALTGRTGFKKER